MYSLTYLNDKLSEEEMKNDTMGRRALKCKEFLNECQC